MTIITTAITKHRSSNNNTNYNNDDNNINANANDDDNNNKTIVITIMIVNHCNKDNFQNYNDIDKEIPRIYHLTIAYRFCIYPNFFPRSNAKLWMYSDLSV